MSVAPLQRGLVAILLLQISLGLLSMTICLPSMQEWGRLFDADQARVQLTFSGYVVAYGSSQLVYGPLSDRYGRKGILLMGLTIGATGAWLAALAPDLTWLTLARVLQGAGCAAGMVLGRSMVQDLFAGPARTRVMAYIGMTLGLCPPAATLIGGQLHVHFGWRANFMLMGTLTLLLLLLAWRRLPASGPSVAAHDASRHWLVHMGAAYARLAREPAFLLYAAVLGLSTAAFYTFLAGAPIVLASYGVGPDRIGWYIMAVPLSYIVGNYATSRVIHVWGENRLMAAGQASALTGILLMVLLGLAGLNTPLAFALPLMLLGVGHGLLNPPALAGTVGQVPALAGSASAVAGLGQQMLGAAGGFAVGLMTHEGSVNLGLLMAGFTLCSIAALGLLFRFQSGRSSASN